MITALSISMKLWDMPCRAIQDWLDTVENSHKMWCIGVGKWKTSLLFLLTSWTIWKKTTTTKKKNKTKQNRTLKGELSKLVDSLYASGNHYKGTDGAKGKTTPNCGYKYGYK